jgi:hypothetical protein
MEEGQETAPLLREGSATYKGATTYFKVFGLSLQKVQEVNKTPQPLRVNVELTNGKRSASDSSSVPTGSYP